MNEERVARSHRLAFRLPAIRHASSVITRAKKGGLRKTVISAGQRGEMEHDSAEGQASRKKFASLCTFYLDHWIATSTLGEWAREFRSRRAGRLRSVGAKKTLGSPGRAR